MDGPLYFFVEGSLMWYSVYCIVCLVTRLISRSNIKQEAINIQVATNLAIAIVAVIAGVLWSLIVYHFYNQRPNHESFIIIEYKLPDTIIMVSIVLFLITGLLFFIPKLRKSWLLSLLILIFINANDLYSLIAGLLTDNLPSEWEEAEGSWSIKIAQFFAFTLFVFLLYLILSRRKKLPYPSAWLR